MKCEEKRGGVTGESNNRIAVKLEASRRQAKRGKRKLQVHIMETQSDRKFRRESFGRPESTILLCQDPAPGEKVKQKMKKEGAKKNFKTIG